MNIELLKTFCSKSRENLNQPFSQGHRTYATDGCVLLSLPRDPAIPEMFGAPKVEGRLKVSQLFTTAYNLNEWELLPVFPEPHFTPCESCGGKTVENGTPFCDECDGSGREPVVLKVPVGRGKRVVSNHYLALLATLPEIAIAPNATGDLEPMVFKFNGGFGILAPMKP